MAARPEGSGILSTLLLSRSRALVARPRFRLLAIVIGLVYALIAMLVGLMLTVVFGPDRVTPFVAILPWGYGQPWWNYPGLLVVSPGFILALPFLPTVFMVLTSAGVGLGMSVAVVLGASLLRQRRAEAGRPTAVSTVTGLTPAMIALVTLGACCSTTAAATAGIGIAAGATGTTLATLSQNSWYIGLFQVVIMYVALQAQEQLVRVAWRTHPDEQGASDPFYAPPPFGWRYLTGALLRIMLLASGLTWALTILGERLNLGSGGIPGGVWLGWLLQNLLLGMLALVSGLVPVGALRALKAAFVSRAGLGIRILLAVAGLSVAVGVPPPLAATGWHGLVNELLGSAGLSSAWGAVTPGLPWGLALALRWGFQYLLLGAFAIAVAVRPEAVFRPILWAVGRTTPTTDRANAVPVPDPTGAIPEGRLSAAARTDR